MVQCMIHSPNILSSICIFYEIITCTDRKCAESQRMLPMTDGVNLINMVTSYSMIV